ncbi:hypothetical protein [Actinoallomurus sp. CA-142502]|uniref:hypothetical protein n=1 Tax=Actinoallomurus sp. CA-142502 TaxID=3239885 RepID=UPI003D9021A8
MAEGIVHIAGPDITVGAQLRQRCAWCGAVLLDYDLTRIAVPEGDDPRPGTWPVGALVEVAGNASWERDHVDGDPLPANACGQIDHEVTGADVQQLVGDLRKRMAELMMEEHNRTAIVCEHTQIRSFGALADAALLAVEEDPILEIRPYYPTQHAYEAACRALANHRERADRYRALATEILSHITQHGHPGEACVRTGWLREETVAVWRAALTEDLPPAGAGPLPVSRADLRDHIAARVRDTVRLRLGPRAIEQAATGPITLSGTDADQIADATAAAVHDFITPVFTAQHQALEAARADAAGLRNRVQALEESGAELLHRAEQAEADHPRDGQ